MHYNRTVSQSAGGSNSEGEDDEQVGEPSVAAAHLRETAIVQMVEFAGYPESLLQASVTTNWWS